MEESKEECEETKDFEVQTAKVPGKKTKKGKIFHINTNQSRGELEVIRQIIAKNANWKVKLNIYIYIYIYRKWKKVWLMAEI